MHACRAAIQFAETGGCIRPLDNHGMNLSCTCAGAQLAAMQAPKSCGRAVHAMQEVLAAPTQT